MTKGKFGFHRCGGEDETGTAAYVQIYVKSSALSRAPDLAISMHLMIKGYEGVDYVLEANKGRQTTCRQQPGQARAPSERLQRRFTLRPQPSAQIAPLACLRVGAGGMNHHHLAEILHREETN